MQNQSLQILHEDNHVLVVIKPHNMLSQADETGDADILSLLKDYIKEKYNKQGNVFLGLVHRLDRPTGGIMVFAKTSKAAARLSAQFKEGSVRKRYLAVSKTPKAERAHLENFLIKDEKNNRVSVVSSAVKGSKKAILDYKTVHSQNGLSLLTVSLETGRGHQIRVQLSNVGAPIVNDVKYGGMALSTNLALWAYELSFEHPTTKTDMLFRAYPPIDDAPWNLFGGIIDTLIEVKLPKE